MTLATRVESMVRTPNGQSIVRGAKGLYMLRHPCGLTWPKAQLRVSRIALKKLGRVKREVRLFLQQGPGPLTVLVCA